MCFYNGDYDWQASVVDHTRGELSEPKTCLECGKKILAGEWRHHVYQQEHDSCEICEDCDVDDNGQPIEGHDCVYGETYEYDRCLDCEHMLECIEAVEAKEGCPPGSRQPSYEGLREEAFHDSDSRFEYAQEAVDRYPELWNHRFIVNLLA